MRSGQVSATSGQESAKDFTGWCKLIRLFSVFDFRFSAISRTGYLGFIAGFLAISLLSGNASLAVEAEKPVQVLGVRQTLPNGLVWLFSEQRGLPLVTLNLLVKAGELRDPQGKEGLGNLTAQLLSQGTKKRSSTQIAQELDFLGARFNGVGEDDFALLSLTILRKDLGQGLALFQDMLLNPVFAPEEIRRKVSQLQASLKADEDDAGVVAARNFEEGLYGAFPYAHPAKGTMKGLAAITRKDLVDFHGVLYRPNNAILSVAGDLSLEEAQKWISQIFGAWREGPIPKLKLPPIPALEKPREVVINKDITQANVVLGNLGLSRSNPDFYAFQVMNYILGGGGFASRLMTDIREKRGLVYSVESSFDPGVEPGPFAVTLETKNPSAGEAVTQVLKEMERLRTTAVSEDELKDAKSYLIGSFPRKMDSLDKRAWLLNYVEFYGLGLDYPWRYPDLVKGLTQADIQKVAQKYLHPDRYLLVVVGKKAELPKFGGEAPSTGKEERKDVQEK